MARSVTRSARTGRFVTVRTAVRSPKTTIRQTVPSKATGNRSAVTGRFVSNATAARHPRTTVTHGK
jgi:hypothetical protein